MSNRQQEFVICHLTFVILAVALLWPVVQHPNWWIWPPGAEHSDLAVTHWPNAHFTRRALWDDGVFPLWRPTIMSGTPFAANPLAGLYYPPNWLFLFLPWLPLEAGFNLSALVHLWLAGAAMYALMRRGLGAGMGGALVAAVAYQASPKLLAHLGAGHVGWAQAWGWLPVVMLCWLKAHAAGNTQQATHSTHYAILAGAALAAQFCADVRMAAYTLIAGAWLLLTQCLTPAIRCQGLDAQPPFHRLRFRLRTWSFVICPFVISVVVFLGLSACQWLPLLALLPETTRSLMTLADAAAWSLPWRYLVGLVLANHGGFHEWMTYAGASTMALAGVGLWTYRREREKRWQLVWLAGLLIGAIWFSLGENGGLFRLLWHVVPGLGMLRVPPRAWVLVVFATAVLAGLGTEDLRRQSGQGTTCRKRWGRALLLAMGTFPAMLAAGYWIVVGAPPLNLAMFGVIAPLTAGLIGFGPHVSEIQIGTNLKPETMKLETILGVAAVLLVAVDLLVVDGTLIQAQPPEAVFAAGREAATWLAGQAQRDRFRVYSPSYSIPQHVAELCGLELADGVDPLQLRVYADYLTRAAGLEPQEYSVTLPPFPEGADPRTPLAGIAPDAEMLGLLGVRYAASAYPITGHGWEPVGQFGEVHIAENNRGRPLPESSPAGRIALADGTTLFQYEPWAVYAGWGISGAAAAGLLISRSRRRRDRPKGQMPIA